MEKKENLKQKRVEGHKKKIQNQNQPTTKSIIKNFKFQRIFQKGDPDLNSKESSLANINTIFNNFREEQRKNCQNGTQNRIKQFHQSKYYRELRRQLKVVIQYAEGFKRGVNNAMYAQCPWCNFKHKMSQVTLHAIKVHGNNYQLYSCGLCDKDFQSNLAVQKHLRQHFELDYAKKQKFIQQRYQLLVQN